MFGNFYTKKIINPYGVTYIGTITLEDGKLVSIVEQVMGNEIDGDVLTVENLNGLLEIEKFNKLNNMVKEVEKVLKVLKSNNVNLLEALKLLD